MPVKTSLFNHPVVALPFKGSIDGHDQHHNIDAHSRSYVKTMETSDAKKVLCKELPHGIYRYKVFLRTNISSNIKNSFFNWQLNYNHKILTPKSVEKWLLYGRYYSSSPYIYVDNASNLSMVGLFLGNGILRVEEFIPRSSINTLIDQEQPCPV